MYDPHSQGIYYFYHGFNWRSFVAWVVGFAPQLPGFVADVNTSVTIPMASTRMFNLAFPLGFAISFFVYWGFCKLSPPPGLGQIDEVDYFGTFTPSEAAKWGITPATYVEAVDVQNDINSANSKEAYASGKAF